MSGRKRNTSSVCKMKMECIECGKVVLSENQEKHIQVSHGNKKVKFKIYSDAKQPKLMFPKVNIVSPQPASSSSESEVVDSEPSTTIFVDDSISSNNNNDSEVKADSIEPDPIPSEKASNDSDEVFENNNDSTKSINDNTEKVGGLFCSGPLQPILDKYNPKDYDAKRDFQASWFKKHPWMDYDLSTNTVTCYPCKTFLQDNKFSYDNWKKSEKLIKHGNCETHLKAMIMWMEHKSMHSSQGSVLSQIDSEHAKQVADNRRYLKLLIEDIAFLGKQNISFRGHTEVRSNLSELSSENRGNFLELLCLRSQDSEFIKERIEKKDKQNRSGQWTSSSIQNELISLLSKYTEARIIQEVNNDKFDNVYIGIISDETSDISRNEQISLVLSYIDSEGRKRESFLGFIETGQTDGETLFNLICNKLSELGVNLSTIVGLGFDSASNMAGAN